ncbi:MULTISPECIES: helix-turn-helix transcriptional regulator [Gordonibacter]|uniref:Helix-turn-helix transcriptional regulator n=1 Tax=Gordonibacter faecis TaxID=3047475 RepID=A0ABT7DP87_9ACTN|nr:MULTISPECIES: helix-turn-helix transcriptional regulator [unclassified Gordonibacter]MDJ1651360.1 helix-turn-helix transcriptional regulator [Gordonibacter sp. KGMB12511]HIW75353.1 helix-turn-helix domain-containing protein [Candidatus Gordonibacter avicola]
MELGKHIKEYRTERGLSQEDLAERIYVSRQTVSNWETDKTYPDVESLLLLSVLFDTTIDELIKGDVETMKDVLKNDAQKMQAYATVGMVIAFAGAVLFVGGIGFWNWGIVPSIIIGLLVWGFGMYLLLKVELMKRAHDVVTYRELVAFSKGEPIDRNNPKSQRARQHRVIKTIILLIVALAFGLVVGGLIGTSMSPYAG